MLWPLVGGLLVRRTDVAVAVAVAAVAGLGGRGGEKETCGGLLFLDMVVTELNGDGDLTRVIVDEDVVVDNVVVVDDNDLGVYE